MTTAYSVFDLEFEIKSYFLGEGKYYDLDAKSTISQLATDFNTYPELVRLIANDVAEDTGMANLLGGA